jgi:hypothetical protein
VAVKKREGRWEAGRWQLSRIRRGWQEDKSKTKKKKGEEMRVISDPAMSYQPKSDNQTTETGVRDAEK